MFRMFKQFQECQPVSYTGILTHTLGWILSGFKDVCYKNPHHDPHLKKPISIYCIHGTADRVGSFTKIATRLQNNLPPQIEAIHLLSFNQRTAGIGIENYAEQLRDKINENNDKDVIIFGHSRGGIVAAYFTEYLAEEANINVHAVMNICSPFKGSDVTFPFSLLSLSIKQMERESPFLSSLMSKIKQTKVSYFCFSAKNDVLVDQASAFIEGERIQHVLLERHGHLSIMSSHKLVNHIADSLVKLFSVNPEDLYSENELLLVNVCHEIREIIHALNARYHFQTTFSKQHVLTTLQAMFFERFNNVLKHYPEAETISEFIESFLQDDSIFANKQKPIDILSQQLNIISFSKCATQQSIEALIKKYKDVSIPNLANDNEEINDNLGKELNSLQMLKKPA